MPTQVSASCEGHEQGRVPSDLMMDLAPLRHQFRSGSVSWVCYLPKSEEYRSIYAVGQTSVEPKSESVINVDRGSCTCFFL